MSSAIKTGTINTNGRITGSRCIPALATLFSLMVGSTAIIAPSHSASAQNLTFGAPKQIPGTPADAEPPQIVSREKNLYVLWHDANFGNVQSEVFFARSTNSGNTFSAPINISNSANVSSSEEAIFVSGKNVFVVWTEDSGGASPEIWFIRSTNEGSSFAPAKKIADTGSPNNPRVTAFDTNVFVAWQAVDPNGISDIFLRQSSNTGNAFAPQINISNNAEESQFRDPGLRQMVVSDKKVIVTWRDSTTPPGNDFEIFYARGK